MKGLIVAVALGLAAGGSVSTGYSNLTGSGVVWHWVGGGAVPEVGDLVTLTGTDRTLQSVTYWIGCTASQPDGTVDVTVRVRAVDSATGLPGAVLATATQTGVAYDKQNWKVTLNMANVTLPNQVFVTVQMANGTQTGYGVVAPRGTPVGSSDPEVWYMTNEGVWGQSSGQGAGNGNLGLAVIVGP